MYICAYIKLRQYFLVAFLLIPKWKIWNDACKKETTQKYDISIMFEIFMYFAVQFMPFVFEPHNNSR